MSYSKFHYFEIALKSMACRHSLKEYESTVFSFAYLAYSLKKTEADFKITVTEAIKELGKKDSISKFMESCLYEYRGVSLEPFAKVPVEELEDYLFLFSQGKVEKEWKSSSFAPTPWEICNLGCQLLEPVESDTFADFCFGSGNFTFNLLSNYDVSSVVGYDISYENEIIGEMIADAHGYDITVVAYDLLKDDPKIKVSKIFCDCPFNLKVNPDEAEKFRNKCGFKLGRVRAEHIFIKRVLDCLKEDGKAVVFIPLGVLFDNSGFTKYLTENGYINAIIQLTANLLPTTGVPFAMLVLSFNNEKIKIVNGSDIFTKSRWKNILSVDNIATLMAAYYEDSDISRTISVNDVRAREYNLNPCHYFYERKISIVEPCEYVSLSELCERPIVRGVQYKAEDLDENSTNIPTNNYYLSLNGIVNNEIIADLPNLSSIDDKYENYCLEEGDLVLAAILATPLKVAVAKNILDKKIIVSSNAYIIRLKKDLILPEYLKALLETDVALKVFTMYGKSFSSAQAPITAEFLNELQIPVLSLERQKELIAKYSEVDNKIHLIRETLKNLSEEKSSIFNKLTEEGRNA